MKISWDRNSINARTSSIPPGLLLASLTRLQKGDIEEAKELMEMAFMDIGKF